MNTKICLTCKKEKSVTEFNSNSRRYDKLQTDCILCRKIYNQNNYKKNKEKFKCRAIKYKIETYKWLYDLKRANPCKYCGESDVRCLDFHHIDRTKKYKNISRMINCDSKEKIIEEINKCEIICANCHRKITHKNIPY